LDELEAIPDGEFLSATISQIPDKRRRSVGQLGLYWASCRAVADSTEDQGWKKKEYVDELTKIALHHYDYYIYYRNEKTGKMQLNVRTKSISFKELAHLDACNFFDEAFKVHADKIGMPVDEWLEFVKFTMVGSK
jgi:hypothetical protein